MDFFRRLFQKSPPREPKSVASVPEPASADPFAVRRQIFEAANANQDARVLKLCSENRAVILENFPAWSNLKSYPEINPKDARQVQFVINGLGKIAQTFRDQLGDGSLWDRLTGSPEENPFSRFDETFKAARGLADEMRYQEAADLLIAFLIDIKGLAGPGADNFRAYCHGLIGTSLFQCNRGADALPHLAQALALCAGLNDADGVGVYLTSLFDVHRYLGQSHEAADYAGRMADHVAGTPEYQKWKATAARVLAGEPLLRMIVQQGDQAMEVEELPPLEKLTKYTCLFERNRPTLTRSTFLVSEGDKLASAGNYDDAMAFYRDAAKADPFNPQPHYQAGITLTILQRYVEAVDEYETVVALAPGWFNVGSDLWMARELLDGRLAHGIFLIAWAVENSGMEASEKLSLIDQAIAREPALPHLHFHRGVVLNALGRREEAIAAWDAGLAGEAEPDIRSRLLAQRAAASDKPTQRRLAQEILNISNANLMSHTMALILLKSSET